MAVKSAPNTVKMQTHTLELWLKHLVWINSYTKLITAIDDPKEFFKTAKGHARSAPFMTWVAMANSVLAAGVKLGIADTLKQQGHPTVKLRTFLLADKRDIYHSLPSKLNGVASLLSDHERMVTGSCKNGKWLYQILCDSVDLKKPEDHLQIVADSVFAWKSQLSVNVINESKQMGSTYLPRLGERWTKLAAKSKLDTLEKTSMYNGIPVHQGHRIELKKGKIWYSGVVIAQEGFVWKHLRDRREVEDFEPDMDDHKPAYAKPAGMIYPPSSARIKILLDNGDTSLAEKWIDPKSITCNIPPSGENRGIVDGTRKEKKIAKAVYPKDKTFAVHPWCFTHDKQPLASPSFPTVTDFRVNLNHEIQAIYARSTNPSTTKPSKHQTKDQTTRTQDNKWGRTVPAFKESYPSVRKNMVALLKDERLIKRDPITMMKATVVALVDQTVARVGDPLNAAHGNFGISTVLNRHLTIKNGVATFSYPEKGGIKVVKQTKSPLLIERLKLYWRPNQPDAPLFEHSFGSARGSSVINSFLKKELGLHPDASVHKWRHARATMLFSEEWKTATHSEGTWKQHLQQGETLPTKTFKPTQTKEIDAYVKRAAKIVLKNADQLLGHYLMNTDGTYTRSTSSTFQYIDPSELKAYAKRLQQAWGPKHKPLLTIAANEKRRTA